MNLLDIIIVAIIIFSGILGFKRGVFKELILFIGIIIIFILSYKLKNYIGDFLVLNFPFMDFPNFLRGATALNIVVYQSIAFIIVTAILYAIYQILVSITGIFEKILRFTIVLGIPSKILGFFVGLIKGYVIAYIVIFFITQPALNLSFTNDSKYANIILTKTPVLNKITNDTLELADEISKLSEIDNVNEMNLRIVDLVLKNKVTDVSVVEKLVDKGKLNVKNIDSILIKYKGE